MNEEMENLLNRLDELMIEAHEKGYSFSLEKWDEETKNTIVLYSASDNFGIDIIKWD